MHQVDDVGYYELPSVRGCAPARRSIRQHCHRPVSSLFFTLIIVAFTIKNSAGSHPINAQLAPVLDGQLFAEYPTESLLSGRFAKVPLIVG